MAVTRIAIVLANRATRIHDNKLLTASATKFDYVLPIYLLSSTSPFSITSPNVMPSSKRVSFMLDALSTFSTSLTSINPHQKLNILLSPTPYSDFVNFVSELSLSLSLSTQVEIFFEAGVSKVQQVEDLQWTQPLKGNKSVTLSPLITYTLNPDLSSYLVKNEPPKSYGTFCNVFDCLPPPALPLPPITSLPPPPPNVKDVFTALKSITQATLTPSLPPLTESQAAALSKHLGGEKTALKRMGDVLKKKAYVLSFEKPKTSPNALEASTTQLSFYLSCGILSARSFYWGLDGLEKSAGSGKFSKPPVSLKGQMLWREYNNVFGFAIDNFDKSEGNKIARQIDWDADEALLKRWREGRTG